MCVSAENEVLLQLSQDVDCKYSAVSGGVQMCHVRTSQLYCRERSGKAIPNVYRVVRTCCLGMLHLCVAREDSVIFLCLCRHYREQQEKGWFCSGKHLTKAFQVPIQSCFYIAFYSFENPCGL